MPSKENNSLPTWFMRLPPSLRWTLHNLPLYDFDSIFLIPMSVYSTYYPAWNSERLTCHDKFWHWMSKLDVASNVDVLHQILGSYLKVWVVAGNNFWDDMIGECDSCIFIVLSLFGPRFIIRQTLCGFSCLLFLLPTTLHNFSFLQPIWLGKLNIFVQLCQKSGSSGKIVNEGLKTVKKSTIRSPPLYRQ